LARDALGYVGHPQIRTRGTFGGSLAHADPAAELPSVMVALGATLRVVGPRGERTVAASDFFVDVLSTALDPCEVLSAVHIPALPPGSGWSFREIARRQGDFLLVGAVATLRRAADGRVADAKLVLAGVGPRPVRARGAEVLLGDGDPGEELFAAAARVATADLDPIEDLHASATYRREAAAALVEQALAEAWQRCS
jgi:carbon-monoxide dehydrogenase medium subunit